MGGIPGKAAFMAHVHVDTSARGVDAFEVVHRRATRLLSREFGIHHATMQVTAVPGRAGAWRMESCERNPKVSDLRRALARQRMKCDRGHVARAVVRRG